MQQVDAKTVRDVCSHYIYDKCPVVVGIGAFMGDSTVYRVKSCIPYSAKISRVKIFANFANFASIAKLFQRNF